MLPLRHAGASVVFYSQASNILRIMIPGTSNIDDVLTDLKHAFVPVTQVPGAQELLQLPCGSHGIHSDQPAAARPHRPSPH